jgi:hypothetical protein
MICWKLTDGTSRREDVLDTSIILRRAERERRQARAVRAVAGSFLLPIGHKAGGNPRRWRVTA